jgi:predicted nucleotidyltransferase
MRNQVAQSLFVNKPHVKLIQWLYVDAPPQERYPPRELARRAGLPYGSIDRALKDLVSRALVVREVTPRGPEYRAPHDDPRLRHLFILLREDSTIVQSMTRALQRFKWIEYACVFGSFARGESHKGSDVDVLILERQDPDRFAVTGALAKIGERIGRAINPEYYSSSEFKRLVDEGEPIALSILGNPRIHLKGHIPWLT